MDADRLQVVAVLLSVALSVVVQYRQSMAQLLADLWPCEHPAAAAAAAAAVAAAAAAAAACCLLLLPAAAADDVLAVLGCSSLTTALTEKCVCEWQTDGCVSRGAATRG